MYFADAGAPAAPDDRAARIGTASKAIWGNVVEEPMLRAFGCVVAVNCGTGPATELHDIATLQPGSESAACQMPWHAALIEFTEAITSSLDMPTIGISPACMQQLEAE